MNLKGQETNSVSGICEEINLLSLMKPQVKICVLFWSGFTVDGETETYGGDTTHPRIGICTVSSHFTPEIQTIYTRYTGLWGPVRVNTECFHQGDPAWTGSMAYCTRGHPRPTAWQASCPDVTQPPLHPRAVTQHIHMAQQAPDYFSCFELNPTPQSIIYGAPWKT